MKTLSIYLNRLHKLASTCKYGELLDEMLRDRLVIGIRNNPTRARLLRVKADTCQSLGYQQEQRSDFATSPSNGEDRGKSAPIEI